MPVLTLARCLWIPAKLLPLMYSLREQNLVSVMYFQSTWHQTTLTAKLITSFVLKERRLQRRCTCRLILADQPRGLGLDNDSCYGVGPLPYRVYEHPTSHLLMTEGEFHPTSTLADLIRLRGHHLRNPWSPYEVSFESEGSRQLSVYSHGQIESASLPSHRTFAPISKDQL